jgi:hypothetical protein
MRQRPTKRHLTMIALLAVLAPTAAWTAEASRTIRESVIFSGPRSERKVVVNNVWGSVKVRGADRETVELTALETVIADDAKAADRAKSEVRLDITSDDEGIELYVDGPFRCECRDCKRCEGWSWIRRHDALGYVVVYDIEVEVPRDVEIEIRTVNRGDIEVDGVRGRFWLANVNGGVLLAGTTGSGRAATVNGPIDVLFAEGPDGDTSFETVNGKVELRFPPALSADFDLQTSWGEIFSEFPVESLPSPPPTQRNEDGRFVIRAGSGTRVRVAEGGPMVTVETLNGNVYLRKSGKER